jgi:hypothetical protein
MSDGLSQAYADYLSGTYDSPDRIVLNAYFRRGHIVGGFRNWWRELYGTDDDLDNAHLMRLAGRFSRRLRPSWKPWCRWPSPPAGLPFLTWPPRSVLF